jgi:hypothetical protein
MRVLSFEWKTMIEGGYQVDFAAREVTVSPFKDALFFFKLYLLYKGAPLQTT